MFGYLYPQGLCATDTAALGEVAKLWIFFVGGHARLCDEADRYQLQWTGSSLDCCLLWRPDFALYASGSSDVALGLQTWDGPQDRCRLKFGTSFSVFSRFRLVILVRQHQTNKQQQVNETKHEELYQHPPTALEGTPNTSNRDHKALIEVHWGVQVDDERSFLRCRNDGSPTHLRRLSFQFSGASDWIQQKKPVL